MGVNHLLCYRPQQQLAVVSHCGILHHMFMAWAEQAGVHTDVQAQLAEDFDNCELRVVRIRDGGATVFVERLFQPPLDL